MKALKKWLFDKEGLFIVITWWLILLIVFTIMLGTGIKGILVNNSITADSSSQYVHEAIKNGDIFGYNVGKLDKVSSIYDEENDIYYVNGEYSIKSTVDFTEEIDVYIGEDKIKATLDLDLSSSQKFEIKYNYTNSILVFSYTGTVIEAVNPSAVRFEIKSLNETVSHWLVDSVDTGITYVEGENVITRNSDGCIVINGKETDIVYKSSVNSKDILPTTNNTDYSTDSSQLNFKLEFDSTYEGFSKSIIEMPVEFSDIQKNIVNLAAEAFSSIIVESIGINAGATTTMVIGIVGDVILVLAAVAFVVYTVIDKKKAVKLN